MKVLINTYDQKKIPHIIVVISIKLIPRSKILLGNLIVTQRIRKFSELHEIQRFVTHH